MRIVSLNGRDLVSLEGDGHDESIMIHCVMSLACHVSLEIVDVRVVTMIGTRHISIRMKIPHYSPSVLESICDFSIKHMSNEVVLTRGMIGEQVMDDTCGYVMLEATQEWIDVWHAEQNELRTMVWSSPFVSIDDTRHSARLLWSKDMFSRRQDVYDRITIKMNLSQLDSLSLA